MPKEITVLTKEYGSFDKATTKMYIADDLETPAEKNILKWEKVYDFIEAGKRCGRKNGNTYYHQMDQ